MSLGDSGCQRVRAAINVPHPEQVPRSEEDVEASLAEGRIVAGLGHPNIVPVYDIGRTKDGACYVVSKFIAGSDLNTTISCCRPPLAVLKH